MPAHQEFLFIDTTSAPGNAPASANASAPADTLTQDTLLDEIRATWRLPFIHQKVRVTLRNASIDEITGHLELAEPYPDHPFNPAKPLHLRIANIPFTHPQITSCVVL